MHYGRLHIVDTGLPFWYGNLIRLRVLRSRTYLPPDLRTFNSFNICPVLSARLLVTSITALTFPFWITTKSTLRPVGAFTMLPVLSRKYTSCWIRACGNIFLSFAKTYFSRGTHLARVGGKCGDLSDMA